MYVGGTVNIVDNYNPNKWSKIEIESIYREFRYIAMDELWFKIPSVILD